MIKCSQSFTKNFGTINAGVDNDMACVLTGDNVGSVVQYSWIKVGWPTAGLPAGIIEGAVWCSGVDTITVRLTNWTVGNIVVGSLTFMLAVHTEE